MGKCHLFGSSAPLPPRLRTGVFIFTAMSRCGLMLERPSAGAGGPRSLTPPQSGLTQASRQHEPRETGLKIQLTTPFKGSPSTGQSGNGRKAGGSGGGWRAFLKTVAEASSKNRPLFSQARTGPDWAGRGKQAKAWTDVSVCFSSSFSSMFLSVCTPCCPPLTSSSSTL